VVEVVEALRGGAAAYVPRFRIAAVEADVRHRARHCDERVRDVLRVHLWCIDDDPCHPVLFEEAQQVAAHVFLEPRPVTRLDEHRVGAELVARPLEVVERRLLPDDVRRELEQDAPELARLTEWLERSEELAKDLAAQLARWPVDA